MPGLTSPDAFAPPHRNGCLLAGFCVAGEGEMARLALIDRGHPPAAAYCCSDRDLRRRLGAASQQPGGAGIDCQWLMVPVEADEVDIVIEYLSACGLRQVGYCKICSNDGIRRARAEVLQCLHQPTKLVVDKPVFQDAAVAEFHPLSWQAWTTGLAGTHDD